MNASAPDEPSSSGPLQAPPEPLPSVDAPTRAGLPGSLELLGLLAVALVPIVVAVRELGRIHPDEVFQALEPAWWRVHGYGVLAWEWREGLRNWAFPGVLAAFLKLAAVLGITDPRVYRGVVAIPQFALHAWSLWAVYRFAARRAGPSGGALAVLLLGLCGPVLLFAGRTLSESISASFLLVAMEALDRPDTGTAGGTRRAGLLGGLALGLAVVARYPAALFVLAALGWLLFARRWRLLAFTCGGGAGVALALGLLDQATWGSPFHSFLAYVRFNVLSDEAASAFGASPPGFYAEPLLRAVPLWAWAALPLSVGTLLRWRTVSLPLTCAAVYTAVLLATPHKEERFLYPALVLGLLAAASQVAAALMCLQRPVLRGNLTVLALILGFVNARGYPSQDLRRDQLRAIVQATRGDATGLLIVNEGLWGSGGFFYIGRKIPWRTCDWPHDAAFQASMRDRAFNRAVTFEGRALPELQAAGFRVIRQVERETILVRD
ncbi:glycosyltransferase family 39 protein [Corallococcus sp. BB11-1]|uniref:glycosyltransferase family 39 protein n=1 Tax=Corallococcus sp. BB11-1 TaxID=2996783 RepID=UPI00226F7B86|nr:glycosyltransferase family 39 protein [Corallococcus sp. BB11-1]MCY1033184.1 glycosyltransferase family 39 protein [Corallococcus sp. BB11-1]